MNFETTATCCSLETKADNTVDAKCTNACNCIQPCECGENCICASDE